MNFQVEIREEGQGREPQLFGVMLTEGRAASGGRAEVFAPNSVEWPSSGVAVLLEHRGEPEVRGHVVRGADGRLSLTARATDGIRKAVEGGAKYMSVEFHPLNERTTKGGVREILRAFVDAATLTDRPEYDTTAAEVRAQDVGDVERKARLWL